MSCVNYLIAECETVHECKTAYDKSSLSTKRGERPYDYERRKMSTNTTSLRVKVVCEPTSTVTTAVDDVNFRRGTFVPQDSSGSRHEENVARVKVKRNFSLTYLVTPVERYVPDYSVKVEDIVEMAPDELPESIGSE